MAPVPPPVDPSSREEAARAEMAATRGSATTFRLLVALPIALLALALVLEGAAIARGESRVVGALRAFGAGADATKPATGLRAANARLLVAAREIEDRFDEGSELARAIRPWGQLALTAGLAYGNEESYVGRDGHLVFRDDFDHLTARGPLAGLGAGDPVATAVAFARQLRDRGVALVLLPVPVKPSIEPRRFTSVAPEGPLPSPRDTLFADALAPHAGELHLFDPTPLLAARQREAAAYLERDTHWRPEAMDAVARELAMRLRAVVDLPEGDPARWLESEEVLDGTGDSAQLLGLPESHPFYGKERVTSRPIRSAEGAPWRPERNTPVLLLGDSFSAIYSTPELGFGAGAGLAERLAFHLGLPVDRIVENAGGASATREALAKDPSRLDGVRAVVWELAARELTVGDWRATPID